MEINVKVEFPVKNTVSHIAQFGTYDIESLGDTTFPKMLSYGLNKYIPCEIELFSMTECIDAYNNNGHVFSFEQFDARHELKAFDAVVIGGGEFIHFSKMDVSISGVQTSYPEGYIWKRPLELAHKYNIPAYINCVGVSYDLTIDQCDELNSYLCRAAYISVRDVFSEDRIHSAGNHTLFCVADNLWYMNVMFPKEELEELRNILEQRTGRDFSAPYIIVQYGTTKNTKILAQELLEIRAQTGLRICLMPVNYCHEDRLGMQLLAEAGNGSFEIIDDYFQPPEIMAVIAGASAFLGTSLHGNLTAASYGVPFVGLDMYPSFVSKMDGIFSMIDCEQYFIPHVAGLKAAFDARLCDVNRSDLVLEKICILQEKLDKHFQRMASIMMEDD